MICHTAVSRESDSTLRSTFSKLLSWRSITSDTVLPACCCESCFLMLQRDPSHLPDGNTVGENDLRDDPRVQPLVHGLPLTRYTLNTKHQVQTEPILLYYTYGPQGGASGLSSSSASSVPASPTASGRLFWISPSSAPSSSSPSSSLAPSSRFPLELPHQRIFLSDIQDVFLGKQSRLFKLKDPLSQTAVNDHCVSICTESGLEVHLEAGSVGERKVLLDGLSHALEASGADVASVTPHHSSEGAGEPNVSATSLSPAVGRREGQTATTTTSAGQAAPTSIEGLSATAATTASADAADSNTTVTAEMKHVDALRLMASGYPFVRHTFVSPGVVNAQPIWLFYSNSNARFFFFHTTDHTTPPSLIQIPEQSFLLSNVSDVYMGRQDGEFTQEEFDHLDEFLCLSLKLTTGLRLDLSSPSHDLFATFLDAFNSLLLHSGQGVLAVEEQQQQPGQEGNEKEGQRGPKEGRGKNTTDEGEEEVGEEEMTADETSSPTRTGTRSGGH